MSERRMFAKAIVTSGRFLKLSPAVRVLYYELGMAADDDGYAEAYQVLCTTKGKEKDLHTLEQQKLIRIINDDLVVKIVDWNINNTIRKDRYHPSIYLAADPEVTPQPVGCQPDNQMTDTVETEVRLGKDRLGKVSPGEVNPRKEKSNQSNLIYSQPGSGIMDAGADCLDPIAMKNERIRYFRERLANYDG